MFTFRASITVAVMAFVVALAALLIVIQVRALSWATHEAASAYMDATSTKAFLRLQSEISAIASLVRVLATSSSVADSNERTEVGRAIPLFKAALKELPQMDSIYVGFDNGAWLQVRRLGDLSDEQRARLGARPGADVAINLVRPTGSGELPMRRIFEDQQDNEVGQLDLWNYGYDARTRPWYRETMKADHSLISSPYLAFSIGAPVITVSAPLRGKASGVLAADLKLDTFSDFVQAQRPGEHGIVLIFDSTGSLIAHPDFAQFVANAMTHPSEPQLPNLREINSGVAAAALQMSHGSDRREGSIRDEQGRDYLFRLANFTLGGQHQANILLLAAQEDFVQNVRRLQLTGLILAIVAGAAFIPAVWIFGSGMSRSLKRITAQAVQLQRLAPPDPSPVTSNVREIHELGNAVNLAQRAIWSFARFVPKEIVRRVVDNSISTELGGVRQEITVVFTDVRDFTTIAESADPDTLMRQTSQYFSVLTEAFLAEGGTVDKFIGDAVMVFWNAPNPQPDHVERACRAVLAGKAACAKLNSQFEADGLKPFFTRFGIHVGEAVVGNLGSTERMNYTALGNTVNLASRLEGLNKQFGTTVIVSEDLFASSASLPVQSIGICDRQGHDKRNPRFRADRSMRMRPALIRRGCLWGLLVLQLGPAVPSACADEGPIKVGILHSLSGTMAISEAVLKDTVLMLIADQNKKGGLLGRQLEPVVVDPASDGGLFAEKARDLLAKERVAVVFGCWTSASRKSVLPVFEQLNGLLFYPVQYEGEESSRNVFYAGAAPNQQAIPAVRYLMRKEGGEIRRWVLLGTDYVYPRTTNQILNAYLSAEGVPPEDVMTIYTPFGHSDWKEIIARIKAFGSEGKKTAVISTINGDANTYFYKELAAQKIDAGMIPVMAFSIGERELLSVDTKPLAGHLAAWNYFQSIKSPENDAFINMWTAFNKQRDKTTNDPMEATFIGFRMWAQAVAQAGTTDVDAVRQAMYGQRIKAPSGFEVVMNTNHHLSKPVMIGKIDSSGTFDVIWRSINPVRADAWSKYIPDSARRTADWTFPWVCGGCTEPTFKQW